MAAKARPTEVSTPVARAPQARIWRWPSSSERNQSRNAWSASRTRTAISLSTGANSAPTVWDTAVTALPVSLSWVSRPVRAASASLSRATLSFQASVDCLIRLLTMSRLSDTGSRTPSSSSWSSLNAFISGEVFFWALFILP
jgi:hypothetical protein